MKCLQRSYLRENSSSKLAREVEVMQTLRHPNIVALYEVIDDPRCSTVFMIQEYMSRPLMPDQLMNQPIPAQECRQYFRDVLRGIAYLHACNIVHRDIKPQNILISSDGIAKIGDFGASAFTGGHECSTYSGTPAFTAPELSLPKDQWKRCHSLMPAVDVFALGATLYTMVTGHPPWMSANEIVLASKIKNLEPKFKANVDPHLKHIILRMLDKDYVTRITVKELEQHEWVTDEGAEPLYALSEGSLCPPAFGASSSSFEGFNPHGVSSSVSASPEKGISKKLVFEEAHLGTKEEIDDGDFVEKFSPSSASAAGKVEIMPQIDRKHEQGQKRSSREDFQEHAHLVMGQGPMLSPFPPSDVKLVNKRGAAFDATKNIWEFWLTKEKTSISLMPDSVESERTAARERQIANEKRKDSTGFDVEEDEGDDESYGEEVLHFDDSDAIFDELEKMSCIR